MTRTQTVTESMWRRIAASQWVHAAATVAVAALLGLLVRSRVSPVDIAMLFLLAVVIVAARCRRGPALLGGALSVALFDFLFVPPYYTFVVLDRTYLVSFGVMFVVALSMTHFTGRIRVQAEDALKREKQATALYELLRALAVEDRVPGQVAIAEHHLSLAARGQASIVLGPPPAIPGTPVDWPAHRVLDDIEVRMASAWAMEHGEAAGWGTRHGAHVESLVLPLRSPTRVLGVAIIRPDSPSRTPSDSQLATLEALAEQTAITIERTGRIGHHV